MTSSNVMRSMVRPHPHRQAALHLLRNPSSTTSHRHMSMLLSTLRRPSTSYRTSLCSLPYPAPQPSTSSTSTSSTTMTLDILPPVSAHPALRAVQIRCGPRNTYRPCHRIRKRRFGFLARLKTRGGRNIIKRRRLKGRTAITH